MKKEKIFLLVNEKTLHSEEFTTPELAIDDAWSNWFHLTRSEKKDKERGYTVYEAVKNWNEDDPEYPEYDLYDCILDIHYKNQSETFMELNTIFDDLNDFIKPSIDEIYDTMKTYSIGNIFYEDDTYQDYLDNPEYYTDEILHALTLMIEIPDIKKRLDYLEWMHNID